jgi:hypothetical protein
MASEHGRRGWTAALAIVLLATIPATGSAVGQEAAPAAAVEAAPEPLTDAELEVLVARIALYPDDLVALIAAASLYPLEIVEAARFLDKKAKDAALQPAADWDGSVISLLNYPEIVRMMSDDLDWTQTLGDAIAWQQKDVLIAIQQLRDEAVASGVIKTDDKVTVVNEGDNIVIQPTAPDVVYVPRYDPQVLLAPAVVPAPITYYPTAYPYYYDPVAPFFAGAVTGAVFAAALDWDDWDVWGGPWRGGGDIDIDCNNCFNNRQFNGDIKFNDVDWRTVDRSKISYNRNDFNSIRRNDVVRNDLRVNSRNDVSVRAGSMRNDRVTTSGRSTARVDDVRKNQIAARNDTRAKGQVERRTDAQRTDVQRSGNQRVDAGRANDRSAQNRATRPGDRPAQLDRTPSKPKPAAKRDNRPKNPSAFGEVRGGKQAKVQSDRGKSARPPKRRPSGGGGGGGRRR